ncbi:MAG: DUF1353 domain-containing protein [Desulfamplus sp.]|nr:DUF1353 domain-containing protein [Desulfamplus sp.]
MREYDIHISDILCLARISNNLVETIHPFTVNVDGDAITVPAGFISNGNSTPRPLWTVIPPLAGPYGEAGIVHDYLYDKMSGDKYNRLESDKIHFSMGRYRGANLLNALTIYQALRAFGRQFWKR